MFQKRIGNGKWEAGTEREFRSSYARWVHRDRLCCHAQVEDVIAMMKHDGYVPGFGFRRAVISWRWECEDPLQAAVHEAFIKTYPKLAATLKRLVDAHQPKRKIVMTIRRRVPNSMVALAAECEVDYLIAMAKAGK